MVGYARFYVFFCLVLGWWWWYTSRRPRRIETKYQWWPWWMLVYAGFWQPLNFIIEAGLPVSFCFFRERCRSRWAERERHTLHTGTCICGSHDWRLSWKLEEDRDIEVEVSNVCVCGWERFAWQRADRRWFKLDLREEPNEIWRTLVVTLCCRSLVKYSSLIY